MKQLPRQRHSTCFKILNLLVPSHTSWAGMQLACSEFSAEQHAVTYSHSVFIPSLMPPRPEATDRRAFARASRAGRSVGDDQFRSERDPTETGKRWRETTVQYLMPYFAYDTSPAVFGPSMLLNF